MGGTHLPASTRNDSPCLFVVQSHMRRHLTTRSPCMQPFLCPPLYMVYMLGCCMCSGLCHCTYTCVHRLMLAGCVPTSLPNMPLCRCCCRSHIHVPTTLPQQHSLHTLEYLITDTDTPSTHLNILHSYTSSILCIRWVFSTGLSCHWLLYWDHYMLLSHNWQLSIIFNRTIIEANKRAMLFTDSHNTTLDDSAISISVIMCS